MNGTDRVAGERTGLRGVWCVERKPSSVSEDRVASRRASRSHGIHTGHEAAVRAMWIASIRRPRAPLRASAALRPEVARAMRSSRSPPGRPGPDRACGIVWCSASQSFLHDPIAPLPVLISPLETALPLMLICHWTRLGVAVTSIFGYHQCTHLGTAISGRPRRSRSRWHVRRSGSRHRSGCCYPHRHRSQCRGADCPQVGQVLHVVWRGRGDRRHGLRSGTSASIGGAIGS